MFWHRQIDFASGQSVPLRVEYRNGSVSVVQKGLRSPVRVWIGGELFPLGLSPTAALPLIQCRLETDLDFVAMVRQCGRLMIDRAYDY